MSNPYITDHERAFVTCRRKSSSAHVGAWPWRAKSFDQRRQHSLDLIGVARQVPKLLFAQKMEIMREQQVILEFACRSTRYL
jgi:hypothetical protein